MGNNARKTLLAIFPLPPIASLLLVKSRCFIICELLEHHRLFLQRSHGSRRRFSNFLFLRADGSAADFGSEGRGYLAGVEARPVDRAEEGVALGFFHAGETVVGLRKKYVVFEELLEQVGSLRGEVRLEIERLRKDIFEHLVSVGGVKGRRTGQHFVEKRAPK